MFHQVFHLVSSRCTVLLLSLIYFYILCGSAASLLQECKLQNPLCTTLVLCHSVFFVSVAAPPPRPCAGLALSRSTPC
mgnify:CR=1 FL=1